MCATRCPRCFVARRRARLRRVRIVQRETAQLSAFSASTGGPVRPWLGSVRVLVIRLHQNLRNTAASITLERCCGRRKAWSWKLSR